MSVINYSCSVNLCENHSAFRGFEVLKICFHTRTAEHITGAKHFLGMGGGLAKYANNQEQAILVQFKYIFGVYCRPHSTVLATT